MTKLLGRTLGTLRTMQGSKIVEERLSNFFQRTNALLRVIWVFVLLGVAYLQAAILSRLRFFDTSKTDQMLRKIVTNYCRKFFIHARIQIQVARKSTCLKPHLEPKQAIYVGNHLSYLDILVLFSIVDASFLAKSEVRRWPLIGLAATIVKTIFVERDSSRGRQHAFSQSARAVSESKRSIIIFPEGTTSLCGKEWKSGAFRIAQATAVPIVPFRLCYSPLRECAFIDDDALIPHMYRLFQIGDIQASIEFGPALEVRPESDLEALIESTKLWVNRRESQPEPLAFRVSLNEKRV